MPSRYLNLAGRSLRLETADAEAAAAVEPALGHLAGAAPVALAVSLRVRTDQEIRHPLWSPDAPATVRFGNRVVAVSRRDPAGLDVFDSEVGLELLGTPAYFASAEVRAHPARSALSTWLAASGALVLHLGAVVYGDKAVLIIGSGGAGKSTATVACGLAGAGVVGDDLCIVDLGGNRATVHALYSTAKLNSDSAALLGAEDWPTLGITENGKRVVPIDDPLRLHTKASVGAIAVLGPPDAGLLMPERIGFGEVFRSLLPTALNAALGAGALDDWFSAVVTLARTVPAYRLSLAWDPGHIADAVAATLTVRSTAGSMAANQP